LQATLEHSLPKPLRYFRVLARFAVLSNLIMMFTPLQLPSVHHNPSFDGVCTWRRRDENAKREFGRQKV